MNPLKEKQIEKLKKEGYADLVRKIEEIIDYINNEKLKEIKLTKTIIQEIPAKKLEWGKESKETMTWEEAKEWCETQGEGWRLPTIIELMEAYQDEEIRHTFQTNNYWSAIEYYSNYVYYLNFSYGSTSSYNKTNNNYVRCVRDIK